MFFIARLHALVVSNVIKHQRFFLLFIDPTHEYRAMLDSLLLTILVIDMHHPITRLEKTFILQVRAGLLAFSMERENLFSVVTSAIINRFHKIPTTSLPLHAIHFYGIAN